MEDVKSNAATPGGQGSTGPAPGEQLETFRWTMGLASRLVQDPALAADLNQEAWTRALERFGNRVPSRRWWGGTLRSLAFRARRGSKRRAHHEAQSAKGESLPSTAELIERNEAQRRVAAAVLQLPEGLRDVVLLHFQEGLSVTAIAQRLGCAKSTVSDRLGRGLDALRQVLDESGDGRSWQACCLLALPPSLTGTYSRPFPFTTWTGTIMAHISSISTVSSVAAVAVLATTILWMHGRDAVESKSAEAETRPGEASLSAPAPGAEDALADTPSLQAPRGQRQAVRATDQRLLDPASLYIISGRAATQAGDPIPDLRVCMRFRDEWAVEAQGKDDGSFELVLDAAAVSSIPKQRDLELEVIADPYLTIHRVWIKGDGTGPIPMPALGERDDIGLVTLYPAGAIQGRVLSQSGETVAGATIDLLGFHPHDPDSKPPYEGFGVEVQSDERGEFLLGHVLGRTVQLSAEHGLYLAEKQYEVVWVTPGQTVGGITLFLTPAAIVSGRVEDTEGRPIAEAYVNGTENWTYLDTVKTDGKGRFRLALRRGSPAKVAAFVPGMVQVSPTEVQLQGPGEVTIVMQREAPRNAFVIQVEDAETGDSLTHVGIDCIGADDERVSESGEYRGKTTEPQTMPEGGYRVDYRPGVDRLLVSAKGYQTQLFSTDQQKEVAPNLTLKLKKCPGIRGRLLRGDKPVRSGRIFLTGVSLFVASPREGLVGGQIVRGETDSSRRTTLKRDWFHPEYVLGLDGLPPVDRLVQFGRRAGSRLDDTGAFFFEDAEEPNLRLIYMDSSGLERSLGSFVRKKTGMDLGEIQLPAPATVTGQFLSRSPWLPANHWVVLLDPRREIPLDSTGRFQITNLNPGDNYFKLEPKRDSEGGLLTSEFKDLPTYHLSLDAGEVRHVDLDLDAFLQCQLDLQVTIAGAAPPPDVRLLIHPLNDPSREFDLSTEVEGTHLQARTRALGPCNIDLVVTGKGIGYSRLRGPKVTLDLQGGAVIRKSLNFEAGTLRFVLPPDLAADAMQRVDLELEPLDRLGSITKVGGVTLQNAAGVLAMDDALDDTCELFGITVPIAPGRYLVSVRNTGYLRKPGDRDLLFTFEAQIQAGKQTEFP